MHGEWFYCKAWRVVVGSETCPTVDNPELAPFPQPVRLSNYIRSVKDGTEAERRELWDYLCMEQGPVDQHKPTMACMYGGGICLEGPTVHKI